MTKDPRVYLAHILERTQKIERFTAGGRDRFLQEAMVQDAVLRNFEVIGEAAKRLDDAYRAAHSEIPWRALAGPRDVLIHQNEGVDLERVWAIVEHDLPGLKNAISALLPPLEETRKGAGRRRRKARGKVSVALRVARFPEQHAEGRRLHEAMVSNPKGLGRQVDFGRKKS